MARKDIIDYYLQQQKVYLGMVEVAKRVDDDFEKGLIGREERDRLKERMLPGIGQIRENYERLSYIVLLLNEPARKSKKAGFRKQNKGIYGRLVASSRETLLREDMDALAGLKAMIAEEGKAKGESVDGQGQGD